MSYTAAAAVTADRHLEPSDGDMVVCGNYKSGRKAANMARATKIEVFRRNHLPLSEVSKSSTTGGRGNQVQEQLRDPRQRFSPRWEEWGKDNSVLIPSAPLEAPHTTSSTSTETEKVDVPNTPACRLS